MFTIEQIKAAHSKVKSGADFPKYIQEIAVLGVTSYTTYVTDGHTEYFGANDFTTATDARYAAQTIATETNKLLFIQELKAHQRGLTDYKTFCEMCAGTGIEKWEVVMADMTCTYFDKAGNLVLEEIIPSV